MVKVVDSNSDVQKAHLEVKKSPKNDIESGRIFKEPNDVNKEPLLEKSRWKFLLFLSITVGVQMIGFVCFWMASYVPQLSFSSVSEHIKPMKPLHHGKVVYLTSQLPDGNMVYKRIITAPCAHGILLFNIGPAVSNEC